MHKAILVFALSLITKNNAICAVSMVRGFCRKRLLSDLKTFTTVAMETKVCHVIKSWTSFLENVIVGC